MRQLLVSEQATALIVWRISELVKSQPAIPMRPPPHAPFLSALKPAGVYSLGPDLSAAVGRLRYMATKNEEYLLNVTERWLWLLMQVQHIGSSS